jgi:hypothetical protein|uniref:Uncharacterized protein n=1 Tax=virus sp. ctPYc18 TaxID=2828251 RepID=A0A8S5RD06_9VIRU|nr:MAG TPA: hypothetical protein [virus sp. ctPYc18]
MKKSKRRKNKVDNFSDIHIIWGKGVCTIYSDKNNYLKVTI